MSYHPPRNAQTIKESLDLSFFLHSLTSQEEYDRRYADDKAERRLKGIKRYLRQRAARK